MITSTRPRSSFLKRLVGEGFLAINLIVDQHDERKAFISVKSRQKVFMWFLKFYYRLCGCVSGFWQVKSCFFEKKPPVFPQITDILREFFWTFYSLNGIFTYKNEVYFKHCAPENYEVSALQITCFSRLCTIFLRRCGWQRNFVGILYIKLKPSRGYSTIPSSISNARYLVG